MLASRALLDTSPCASLYCSTSRSFTAQWGEKKRKKVPLSPPPLLALRWGHLLQPLSQTPHEQPRFASSSQHIPLKLRVCPHSSSGQSRTEPPHAAKAVVPLPQSWVWVPLRLMTGCESSKTLQSYSRELTTSAHASVDHPGGPQLGCLPFHKSYGARHSGLPRRGGSTVTHLHQFPRQLGQT